MSCGLCLRRELKYGSDGSFGILKRVAHRRDESTIEEHILEYTACADVFGTDVELDDHFTIRYCPMCGEKL